LLTALLTSMNDLNQNYIVNMIFELVKAYAYRSVVSFEEIYGSAEGEIKLPFELLGRILQRKSDNYFVVSELLLVITFLLMNMDKVNIEEDVHNTVFLWCTNTLEEISNQEVPTHSSNRIKLAILTNLSVLVKNNTYRRYFEDHKRVIKMLIGETLYDTSMNEQILYQTLNILWVLTFNERVKRKFTKPKLVRNLCNILHVVSKDKILRLSLSLLRNILHEGDNGEVMIGSRIMDTLNILNTKKEQFGDEDIADDILFLEKNLEPIMNAMSSFDRFKHQILSGKLDSTTPSHKSERFWRENCTKFEENNYEVLRNLKDILENENDADILALACWDLGEFVRFHPRGKAIIDIIEAKVPMMKLLNHGSEKVKGESLLALQKLMVTNWEFLQ